MDGGEVYFLADRVNPTRFDVLTEIVTTGRQDIAFEEVKKDPPKLCRRRRLRDDRAGA